ncbi:hypothetical protein GUITHDRAFT_154546 [Guillardia theta CCMP2712]|uniref:Uncharacterized protein n=2 Tax=Guillardia theta TaxID=55529 RepID=L1IT58_GUITC|nr:hypothetical protein GUITHDRAFT_154546 [Guillardia theta CCMP2712]EKX39025.1 hypothetical protein GUITHDRAFT_154546 [Guillardia theta CCMP2712]|eukprot:XP_005826005.1 hypothetical protein GUITHDRAFT_154546 [Guillardia theta CCMP2712]
MPSWKSIGIVATAALSCQVSSVEAYVSSPALKPVSARAGAACNVASLAMSSEERLSRRAAIASTLLTLPVLAAKSADAAGLNLMPPALQSITESASRKKASKDLGVDLDGPAPEPVSKKPGFTVPKLGPQRKKAAQEEEGDAPKPARKMSMPKFGEVKSKEPKAESETEGVKLNLDAPKRSRPGRQSVAGATGKERFESNEISSLEQKLRSRSTKVDAQIEKLSEGTRSESGVPSLNPFSAK